MKKLNISNETSTDDFDAWYYEECGIAAAEIVGSNSYEYDSLHIRFYEDEVHREAGFKCYTSWKNYKKDIK